jgi:hypothetical protein
MEGKWFEMARDRDGMAWHGQVNITNVLYLPMTAYKHTTIIVHYIHDVLTDESSTKADDFDMTS